MWLGCGKIGALCAPASLHVQTHDILLQLGCLKAGNRTQQARFSIQPGGHPLYLEAQFLCKSPPGQKTWLDYCTGLMSSASEDSVVK